MGIGLGGGLGAVIGAGVVDTLATKDTWRQWKKHHAKEDLGSFKKIIGYIKPFKKIMDSLSKGTGAWTNNVPLFHFPRGVKEAHLGAVMQGAISLAKPVVAAVIQCLPDGLKKKAEDNLPEVLQL